MLDANGINSSPAAAGWLSLQSASCGAAATAEPEAARLVACSADELGCFAEVLAELGGHALVRGAGGTAVPMVVSRELQAAELGAEATLSAPVYDANGEVLAFLEVIIARTSLTDVSQRLLASLVNSVARCIAERWFRIRYRRQWIVAALRTGTTDLITLAVDRDTRVVGADHWARRQLAARGLQVNLDLRLAAVFDGCKAPLRTRRFADAAVTLFGAEDGAPWSVLITPPDPSADPFGQSERVLVHARPRLGALTSAGLFPARQSSYSGLPPRMLRRVDEYIDAHLDSVLEVPELARSLGLSQSHFARCFRRTTGLTPHSYVMRRRLTCAQKLLTETDRTLVDIALATGFADQSHFSRRFHQLTGLPPRAFRALHR
jgi:AraC-like DNA-binding protein